MSTNITFSLGNIALIDKIDADTNIINSVLAPLAGRSSTFIPGVKLLISNKLGQSISINRLMDFTPDEELKALGFEEKVSARSLYRILERLGNKYPVFLGLFQDWIHTQNLVDPVQFIDFSSSYFEGTCCPLGKRGYSRDHQPGKLQFTFGISVGLNDIPTMLTIQKGNVQDKQHMKSIIGLCSKVLPEHSLLVFDCGGNTSTNKEKILDLKFHFLTLKAKKKNPYLKEIAFFNANPHEMVTFLSNDNHYSCVKHHVDKETYYIYFSKKLGNDQFLKKEQKFKRDLEKGEKLSKKVRKGKDLDWQIAPEGWIVTRGEFQKVFGEVQNPFITGLEGFFILESSIDDDPMKILEAYKNRNKAEIFIRDIKEGAEIRPIRHWSKNAVIGYVLIVFLTKLLTSLTHFFCKNSDVKNLKVLKKYLMNLTLTIVYPPFGYPVRIISNFTPHISQVSFKK